MAGCRANLSYNASPMSKPSRPAKRVHTEKREGVVQPITLGQDGVTVLAGRDRYTLTAGVPGDEVSVMVHGNSGRADPKPRMIRPSPDRVPASCPVHEVCGACSLMGMAYRAQVSAKARAVKRMVRGPGTGAGEARVGRLEGLERSLGYRTKLLMPAFTTRGGRLRFGFYQPGTTSPVMAEHCPVQHPLCLGLLAMVRALLQSHGVTASIQGNKGGWLHGLSIRVDPPTGAAELVLCGRTTEPPGGQELCDALARLPGVNTLAVSAQPNRSSYLLTPPYTLLAGAERTPFTLNNGTVLWLSPGAFFQTSHHGAEQLLTRVEALWPPGKAALMADLYGGAGLFARALASRWDKALVVERSPEAVADLKWAAKKLPGLEAWQGSVEERASSVLRRSPDLVLLDPPRRGCKAAVLSALNQAPPPTVLYVACGVQSFMRDTKTLTNGAFRLTNIEMVDMFPHTSHLEMVGKFEAK